MKKNIFLAAFLMMAMFTLSASANGSNPFNGRKEAPTVHHENLLYTYHIAYCVSPGYPTLTIHVDYNYPWDYYYAFGVNGNIGYIFDTVTGSISIGSEGVTVNSTLGVTYWTATASGYIEVAAGYYPYAF